eukprot:scaffold13602_cov131-Isochrysis_galbana.AAC.1
MPCALAATSRRVAAAVTAAASALASRTPPACGAIATPDAPRTTFRSASFKNPARTDGRRPEPASHVLLAARSAAACAATSARASSAAA